MRGTARVEPGAVQRGKAFRFGEELAVCPHAVAEPEGRTVGMLGIRAVVTQERRGVRSGERHFGQRRSQAREGRVEYHLSPGLGVPPHSPISPAPGRRSP